MLLARTNSGLARRRGAILLIVLTLVALFAVVGLSFALYAEAEALAARTRREAKATSDDPPPADAMASLFLGQMLYSGETGAAYGTGNSILKPTRGTEHATMVYGDNPNGGNSVPYNGVGTFYNVLNNLPTSTGAPIATLDRRNVINYGVQVPRDINGNIVPLSIHVVDPSHTEFRNSTQLGISPGNAATFPTKAYVARNAPYTYPDRLNAYVAMQDPSTGRILVPSYHRPSLFGSLASSNVHWRDMNNPVYGNGDTTGRYKILRPRPWDHRLPGETEQQSQFPFPPANADGTITGDVQNIPQTDGRQQNDAVWIDMGLPMVQWRGRNLQPLVAATILPLDGRVNVNVAGNRKNATNQGSTHGFGPWEIGLTKILGDTDANAMVDARATLSSYNPRGSSVTSHTFAPSVTQSYAAVNWDAGTTVSPLTLPTGNQSDPTYGMSGFDYTTTANATTESDRHPGLFLPYSWNGFTSPGKLFAHTDLRRASHKYSGKPYDYNSPFFGATAPTSLTGTGPGDPSNRRRALLTTASNSLARPGLMPNFADNTALGGPLELNAAGQLNYPTGTYPPTLTNPIVVGPVSSDFAGTYNARNAKADLGPVDLNRPLADYRAATNPTGAISPANFMNFQAATNDRQTLARDIFVRLILATGAKAVVNPTAGTLTLPRPQVPAAMPAVYDLVTPGDTSAAQYNALRYLAQLAANIVDTADNDDVATTFVWNPITVTSLFAPDGGYTDMTTLFNMPGTTQAQRDAYTGDRTVFGVEKPRVVINEVYGELVNDPADMLNGLGNATQPYHARFWIELLNPGNTQDTASTLGDGTAKLRYVATDGAATPYNPYRIQVYRSMDANTAVTQAGAQNNPAGDPNLPTPTTPAFTRDFSETDAGNAALRGITPNDGTMTATTLNGGFAVYGPQTAASEMGQVYRPNTTTTTPPAVVPSMTNGHFTSMLQDDANTNPLTGNLVLLQRLACPYLPPGPTNPYLTVDYFQNVTAHDAVRRASDSVADRTPNGGPSSGRLQPFFGRSTLNVNQTSMDANAAMYTPMFRHSLFSHNDGRSSPFDWLAHFDRPLVNATELQVLAACRSQELTQLFADAAGTANSHAAQLTSATAPLYRALELLTVKPWGYGLPAEGRVPGKINVNMIWDRAVLEALLDRNAGNNFTDTGMTNDVTTLYDSLFFGTGNHARTKDTNRVPGSTYDETGTTSDDRPFKPFGTASFAATAGSLLPGGSGLADTLLRDGTTAGTPAILTTGGTHPYQRAEMLRKMYNNITTTSDTYLVVMTVGFFEVRNTVFPISPTNPIVLGKEVSDQSSGDLRGKFVAIVDRSMMAIDGGGQQVDGLWQTTINEPPYDPTINPGPPLGIYYLRFPAQGINPLTGNIRMLYEGRSIDVAPGSQIVVGTGANAELMAVAAYGGRNPDGTAVLPANAYDTATGLALVTLGAPPAKLHQAGAAASNAISTNPGPQPNFDVNSSRYKGVVPYFERVEIGK